MKKLTILFLVILCVVFCFGCGQKEQFSEYYGLETMKGLEVYLWQKTDGNYMCGVLSGTNRGKTFEEINSLTRNGATVEQMKDILLSYHIGREMITIIPIRITDTSYEVVNSNFESANKIFWGD